MSGYFLHKREKKPLEKLKLAMKVGDSGHYAFKRVLKRHYAQTAQKCSISDDGFESIIGDLREKYEALSINDEELDPLLSRKTLDLILEGMNKRAKLIFA